MTRAITLPMLALLLAAAAPVPTGPVRLTAQPRTPLDATARQIAAADVADGGRGALVLLGSQPLGTVGTGPALFVQVQSERACGSAGCSTSIYLPTPRGWQKVLDAVSGTVIVETGQHRGMHDLLVGQNDRWVWDGHAYTGTLPAPATVDLRPRDPPSHAGATRTRSPAHP